MSLFDKKAQLPRSEFKDILKRSNITTGTKGLNIRERLRIEEEVFPKKYGETISKSTFNRGLNNLKKKATWEVDFIKKHKLHKKIKYLKKLEETGGIDKK